MKHRAALTSHQLQTCYHGVNHSSAFPASMSHLHMQHITLRVNEVVFELMMEKTADKVLRTLYNSTDADGANSLKTAVACLDFKHIIFSPMYRMYYSIN